MDYKIMCINMIQLKVFWMTQIKPFLSRKIKKIFFLSIGKGYCFNKIFQLKKHQLLHNFLIFYSEKFFNY